MVPRNFFHLLMLSPTSWTRDFTVFIKSGRYRFFFSFPASLWGLSAHSVAGDVPPTLLLPSHRHSISFGVVLGCLGCFGCSVEFPNLLLLNI